MLTARESMYGPKAAEFLSALRMAKCAVCVAAEARYPEPLGAVFSESAQGCAAFAAGLLIYAVAAGWLLIAAARRPDGRAFLGGVCVAFSADGLKLIVLGDIQPGGQLHSSAPQLQPGMILTQVGGRAVGKRGVVRIAAQGKTTAKRPT